MTVAIVDYGSGNLRSCAKAFERAEAEAGLSLDIRVTDDPGVVLDAHHVVLPGVGAFADCRRGLEALPGMIEALETAVVGQGKPFLGICVGMQLMATRGLEYETAHGLDWIKGEVRRIEPADPGLKIPHMGWNDLAFAEPRHPLFDGVAEGADVYFVHSYAFVCADPGQVLATVDYGGPVVAAIGRDNLVGTQFHPEKSQTIGVQIIRNFVKWNP